MTSSVTPPSSEDMRNTIVLAVLLASSAARAESTDDKSPALATAASVGVTVGSIALAIRSGEESGLYVASAGLLVGPSVGHWYAGDAGVPGLVIRGAGFGLMALTVESAFVCKIGDGDTEHRNCSLATAGFAVGFGVMLAGVLYDFGTAGGSARRANLRTVKLAPTMVAGPQSTGAGLGFSAAF